MNRSDNSINFFMTSYLIIIVVVLILSGAIYYLFRTTSQGSYLINDENINSNRSLATNNANKANFSESNKENTFSAIIYAVKKEKEAIVWRENLETKNKSQLLTYQESRPFSLLGNYLEGLGPNITMTPDGKRLIYIDSRGINIYDLATGENKLIINKTEEGKEDYIAPRWSFEKENQKLGVFDLFLPRVSFNQKYLSFVLAYQEGSATGVYNLENGDFVVLTGKNNQRIGWHDLDWSKDSNDLVVVTSSQAYSVRGLFITSQEKFDRAENYLDKIFLEPIYFSHPSWAFDSSKIVFSYEKERNLKENPKIGIINRDGTDFQNLVADGNINDYPIFSNQDIVYYFKDSGDDRADGVWIVDNKGENNEQLLSVADPNDFYQPFLVEDNYLVILVKDKDNTSVQFHNQILVYGIKEKEIIFQGEDLKEGITFLGFM